MDDKSYVQQSLCSKSCNETEEFFSYKVSEYQRKQNRNKEMHFSQLHLILRELTPRRVITFAEIFELYCSGIKQISNLSYGEKKHLRQNFRAKLLGVEGLPVMIINLKSTHFVILTEGDTSSDELSSGLNEIIAECVNENSKDGNLQLVAPYFKNLMTLLTTSRDRSLVLWHLKQLFSVTSLEQYLFLSKKVLYDVEDQLYPILEALETKMEEFRRDAEKHVEQIKHSLKVNIEKEEHLLGQKRKRLSENLIQDKEFDIYNKKQRLESLKKQTKKIKIPIHLQKTGRVAFFYKKQPRQEKGEIPY